MRRSSSIRTGLIVSFSALTFGVCAFLGAASCPGAGRIVEAEAVDTLRVSAERLADVRGAWIDAQLREPVLRTKGSIASMENSIGRFIV